ncbi:Fe-S cluster assembly protein SufB, partial [Patescibacteria group bacterium]|nr:Fe-S cluster assembly protein SufB [Patescibacteria group bacterium]
MAEKVQTKKLVTDKYKFGFAMPENFVFRTRKGIDEKVVREISWQKSEPDWMTNLRLKGYKY